MKEAPIHKTSSFLGFSPGSNVAPDCIQPKLAINQPGDKYEQEADSVADQVIRKENSSRGFESPLPIQRKCNTCEEEALQAKPQVGIQREGKDENSTLNPGPGSNTNNQGKSLGIDWFGVSRPFHTRGVPYLINSPTYSRSISLLWGSNFQIFSLLGLGPEKATSAANLFTPIAVDAALSTDYPTSMELFERKAQITNISASATVFTFDLSNLGKTIQFAPANLFRGDANNPYVQKKEASGSNPSPPYYSPDFSNTLKNRKGKGKQMPSKTQESMGKAFGRDFSEVRVHAGQESAEMSQQIHAKAFTHGSDIYFNQGEYQPESSSGKHLLAHELTHVVQQNGGKGLLQRSTGGAVAGGIIGGLLGTGLGIGIGAALGETAGAVAGGIVGGLVGSALGLLIGDDASSTSRSLDEGERTAALSVFGNSLNLNPIRIATNTSIFTAGANARTPGNTLYLSENFVKLKENTPLEYHALIVHELTHSWQRQHGLPLLDLGVDAIQGQYLRRHSHKFIDYARVEKKIKTGLEQGKCFRDFTAEEQGDITMYYYLSKARGRDQKLYMPYIEQVRKHGVCKGAPYYTNPYNDMPI